MSKSVVAQFAVVGHPNKGKSSIVSTLSQKDSIEISSRSGTTTKACAHEVVTSRGSYQLIDTPGFQRPSKALRWLMRHCENASERARTVSRFVNDEVCQKDFPDEVSLLMPIVNGAAILYVVDGSRPYGVEYEAEMEILRWTGRPSMALINPIENSDYVNEWESALTQYFKSVRVFNPLKADFDKQLELLQAFVHLNPVWAQCLSFVTQDLIKIRQQQRDDCAVILSRLVDDLCQYQFCQKVLNQAQAKQLQPLLAKQYRIWMKRREDKAIKELLSIYAHYHANINYDDLDLPPDLFDVDEWYAWGLNKKQLVYAATMAGAVGGATVDLAVAGHSFMLGAISGGIVGFGSAWLGAGKLVKLKLKGLPLGGYQACVGPIKNRNFPYVVIGRFVYLYGQISRLNHANRNTLKFDTTDFQKRVDELEKSDQQELHKMCGRIVKQKTVDDMEKILLPLLN